MKYIKYLIPIFILFIGFSVSAKGTMFLANGTILNQCTGSNCAYPYAGTTNLRFILDSISFNADSQYTFKLNFSAGTSMASPTLTDCGLNINGAYVSPESRNSSRINYECSSDYSNCTSTYASTIVWTSPSSLSSVPVFIQCDMTPSATRYNQTNFAIAVTDSNGSVINAINDNTDRMIEVNNYNANQNNSNRDSNSEMIGGKIDNNTNVIGGKLDSHANTISGKLQQIIDNLTNLGSNIISGISSTIQNVGSAITGKIQELIGLNEVCTIYYKTLGNQAVFGSPGISNMYLDSNGNEKSSSYYNISDYINLPPNAGTTTLSTNSSSDNNNYYCLYRGDKSLVSCDSIGNSNNPISISSSGNNRFIRFSYRTGSNYNYVLQGDCQRSGILGLFNNFKQFVSDFFSNALGLNRIGSVLDRHKGILENPAFDGISSVINAPRQLIQSMNNYSCTNITTSVFNKSITLPSGCFFWEREDVSSFRAFWNLLFGGFLIYKFAYRLFKVLNDCLDPTKDDIGGFEV